MQDWTGNHKSTFSTLGASSHSAGERAEHDYYATEPKATELLLQEETFSEKIWECACGEGHMAEVFRAHGYDVKSTDLVDRGYGTGGVDFLLVEEKFDGDIVTNPPYKYAKEFVENALDVVTDGHKVAMFVKLTFLETKGRKQLFITNPPKTVYVSASRLHCWKNGDEKASAGNNAVAYIWVIWEKGHKGTTEVKWIN